MKQKFPVYSNKKPTVNLKRFLALKFPTTRTSVKLQRDNQLNTYGYIEWVGGPSVDEVAQYCERFVAGGYAGPQWEYMYKPEQENQVWLNEFGRLHFLSYQRRDPC